MVWREGESEEKKERNRKKSNQINFAFNKMLNNIFPYQPYIISKFMYFGVRYSQSNLSLFPHGLFLNYIAITSFLFSVVVSSSSSSSTTQHKYLNWPISFPVITKSWALIVYSIHKGTSTNSSNFIIYAPINILINFRKHINSV